MKPGSHVILNGELMLREEARIEIDDLGFLVGDGVFETLRLYRGAPFLLEEHLERLFASLRQIALDVPWQPEHLADMVLRVVARNASQFDAGRLRITVSRGPGMPPARPEGRPTLLITADAYEPPLPTTYGFGVRVEVSRHVRQACSWRQVKSLSYQPNLQLRNEASADHVFEVLQWNDHGHLTEGSFTNVFVVDSSGVLRTPAPREGCLEGVTRNAVLTIAEKTNLPYLEGGVGKSILMGAREVFLSGSLIEIMPVREILATAIPLECPGTVTTAVQQAYRDWVSSVVGSQ